jgi:4-alpha-glucanotransferase
MKFIFKLHFHTNVGQSLWLTGNHALLGEGKPDHALPLQYLDEEFWQGVLEIPDSAEPKSGIIYNYILRNPDGSLIYDWGGDKIINPEFFRAPEILIIDSWDDASFVENAFYTEPFKEVLLRENFFEVSNAAPSRVTHILKVKAPLLAKGQILCVLGSAAALAHWDTAAPILMSHAPGDDFFSARLDLGNHSPRVEYKYGIYDTRKKAFMGYEQGGNRVLNDGTRVSQIIVNDGFARIPSVPWKGAGIAIPVFGLRSENSFGVGEFADLKMLVDWCQRVGLKLIQILPINDTCATHTWLDSYPYSSISAFALHPIYLNLGEIVSATNKKLLAQMEAERTRLNSLEALDYEAVWKAKLDLLKQIYSSQKNQTFKSKAYQEFFAENKHWLVPYAAFCHLRDQFGTSDFNQWPDHREYDEAKVTALTAEDSSAYDSIAFNYFVQFHLHLQLKEAADYAHSHGIILKGDIPIGVARHGADTWQDRELFNLHMQAGAPPDAFTDKGQNWGFPTYNWQRMKADGFKWWKERFEQMSRYFDAFRIDHILGFFRIWSIPIDAIDGLMGHFVPALPVRPEEFSTRGIAFKRDRYTQPYIDDGVLADLFDSEATSIKRQFLESHVGVWRLKEEFSTQRKVEKFFAQMDKSERNEKLKSGLQQLIGNVILFEDHHLPGKFHFRFAIDKTPSFQKLDPRTRGVVWDLYVDYFFRRQDAFWKNEAMEKLPALKRATNMLVCGEDLGLVPACVPDVMHDLGLLSLEIQRMPKDSSHEFFRPATAPYLSVVTPSTHDMSTIREWWEENRTLTQKFFNTELHRPGEAPASCEPWISKTIIEQHLASPAMWSIFQLQDLLGLNEQLRRPNPAGERINVPANPRHYWRYRMHLSLESLLRAEKFNDELRRLVLRHGR